MIRLDILTWKEERIIRVRIRLIKFSEFAISWKWMHPMRLDAKPFGVPDISCESSHPLDRHCHA
jgi:hypothetical protein